MDHESRIALCSCCLNDLPAFKKTVGFKGLPGDNGKNVKPLLFSLRRDSFGKGHSKVSQLCKLN